MTIRIHHGSITDLVRDGVKVGAVVNAANTTLMGGGGVDGAIHRIAGPMLAAECCNLQVSTGEAVITAAYDLERVTGARWIIHAVGPVYKKGRAAAAERELRSVYRACLDLCVKHRISSVAFPAISCGVYGYPVKEAARIAVETISSHLTTVGADIAVTLVAFTDDTARALEEEIASLDGNR